MQTQFERFKIQPVFGLAFVLPSAADVARWTKIVKAGTARNAACFVRCSKCHRLCHKKRPAHKLEYDSDVAGPCQDAHGFCYRAYTRGGILAATVRDMMYIPPQYLGTEAAMRTAVSLVSAFGKQGLEGPMQKEWMDAFQSLGAAATPVATAAAKQSS